MDDFLLEAREMLITKNPEVAEKVYRLLFDALEMGEESSYLPGEVYATDMLEVDLHEHVTLFIRSIYINTEASNRVQAVYEAIDEFVHLVSSSIKLADIRDVLEDDLPAFDEFLRGSIDFLLNYQRFITSDLLREAVYLDGGISAISAFAKKYVNKFPMAYVDWIHALEMESTDDYVLIDVAKEGLSNIPLNFVVRARVAAVLIKTGEKLQDNRLKLEGLQEQFNSHPSMNHLVELYTTAIDNACFDVIRAKVEKRIMQLRKEGKESYQAVYPIERITSKVSDEVYIASLLLAGNYQQVFAWCKSEEYSEEGYNDQPKSIFVTLLMKQLSGKGKNGNMIEKECKRAISNLSYDFDENFVKHYFKVMHFTIDNNPFSKEQEEFYISWCEEQVGNRIDFIVSNKYRGSYHKAASLLVAMAETLSNRENRQQGLNFIAQYKNKYSRYSAFKRELEECLALSAPFSSV